MPKPRHPIRSVIRRGDRMLVYEVVHPERWKYRDLLVEFDARHGQAGAWVRAIDEVFDQAWLLEQKDVAHPVARSMSWPWAIATRNIADVADLVCAIRSAGAGFESVLRRLRIHEEFVGTSFEGRVARLLVEAGLEFEFVRATGDGKALDIRVGGALPFLIEVKSRQRAFRSRVEDSLTYRVWPHVAMAVLGCRLVFDWSGPEVQAVTEGQADTQLPELARRSVTAIRDALNSGGRDSVQVIELRGLNASLPHPLELAHHVGVDARLGLAKTRPRMLETVGSSAVCRAALVRARLESLPRALEAEPVTEPVVGDAGASDGGAGRGGRVPHAGACPADEEKLGVGRVEPEDACPPAAPPRAMAEHRAGGEPAGRRHSDGNTLEFDLEGLVDDDHLAFEIHLDANPAPEDRVHRSAPREADDGGEVEPHCLSVEHPYMIAPARDTSNVPRIASAAQDQIGSFIGKGDSG